MKVLSWNVRSMGTFSKGAVVKSTLVSLSSDIVYLQETKLRVMDQKIAKSLWNSRHVGRVALDLKGSAGGVLVIWKENSFDVLESIIDEFFVSVFKVSVTSLVGGSHRSMTHLPLW